MRMDAVEAMHRFQEAFDRHEPTVHAFAHVDFDGAWRRARQLGDSLAGEGPLAGQVVAVKDVVDTVDQPTEFGSPIHLGRRPGRDAACVARLRTAGVTIVGKTVTCEFASFHPGPTGNPRAPGHTPGGSSSGSAAAVAAGMVPAAVGTQTAGSVIRPAAYCGVVGYKPTFGLVNRAGVLPFAESLDTVGVLAATVADAARVAAAMAARPALAPGQWPRAGRHRLGLCRTPEWTRLTAAGRAVIERSADRLADAGWEMVEADPGEAFDEAVAAQHTIMAVEGAHALHYEHTCHAGRLSHELRALLDEGAATSPDDYDTALATGAAAGRQVAAALADVDALLTPATPGPAPEGLASTGDPLCNRRWTLVGTPAVTVPAGAGDNGLPLGVQLVGGRGADAGLLRLAGRAAELFDGAGPT